MDASYEEALKVIESNEARSQPGGVVVNAMNAAKGNAGAKPYGYEDALKLMGIEEGGEIAQQEQARKKTMRLGGLLAEAEAELGSVFKELEKEVELGLAGEERIRQRLRRERYVWMRLPLHDQISELEKVIQGIGENAFDEKQLAIIREEAAGLYESLRHEKEHETELEKGLASIRERRLSELRQKLHSVKV